MSIKMSKENICINQLIGQKEETFLVQNDAIVPDIKPDALNVMSSNGNICIYKKEIQDGKIRFDGSVYIYTIYVADDEKNSIRTINSSLDFSKTISLDGVKDNMQLKSLAEIKSIDCKVLNGRKINIQANIKIGVEVYSNENIEIVQDLENISDLQKLNKVYNINSLLGSGTTKAYAKDTIKIPAEDNLMEIVKVSKDIENEDTKISYNKVLAKADAKIKIVYLTEDGRINSVISGIPIMGFIDIQNINEDNICESSYELRNILVKPNNVDDHSIYVELEVGIDCFVYENKSIDIIEDLYSPSILLKYEQKNAKIMQNKRKIKQICNIRQKENIPEIENNKICDVEVKPIIVSSQITDGRVTYECEIELVFLYEYSDTGRLESKSVIEPFTFNVINDTIKSNEQINTNIAITSQDFIIMPEKIVDMKIDLEFMLELAQMQDISIIKNVEEDDKILQERCSIIIYYTKPGDTLWNIAKRFKSTVEEIAKINEIENPDIIMQGEQLFIPR